MFTHIGLSYLSIYLGLNIQHIDLIQFFILQLPKNMLNACPTAKASSKILFFSFTFLFVEHFLQHQFSREWNCPQKRWRKDYMDQIRSPLGTNTITISGHFLILDFPPLQFGPGPCWEIHGLANLYESFERRGGVWILLHSNVKNVREVWKSFGRGN